MIQHLSGPVNKLVKKMSHFHKVSYKKMSHFQVSSNKKISQSKYRRFSIKSYGRPIEGLPLGPAASIISAT